VERRKACHERIGVEQIFVLKPGKRMRRAHALVSPFADDKPQEIGIARRERLTLVPESRSDDFVFQG